MAKRPPLTFLTWGRVEQSERRHNRHPTYHFYAGSESQIHLYKFEFDVHTMQYSVAASKMSLPSSGLQRKYHSVGMHGGSKMLVAGSSAGELCVFNAETAVFRAAAGLKRRPPPMVTAAALSPAPTSLRAQGAPTHPEAQPTLSSEAPGGPDDAARLRALMRMARLLPPTGACIPVSCGGLLALQSTYDEVRGQIAHYTRTARALHAHCTRTAHALHAYCTPALHAHCTTALHAHCTHIACAGTRAGHGLLRLRRWQAQAARRAGSRLGDARRDVARRAGALPRPRA